MQRNFTRWATACKLLAIGLVLAAARPAAAQTAYGLFQGRGSGSSLVRYNLVKFNVATPGTYTFVVPITGLSSINELLVGLDVRPATGELFALDYLPASSQARLYTLNPATGALTAVGPAFTLALGISTTNYADVEFDFDPTTDRIRVTTVNRANYRLNPITGALDATDGTLTYASTDPNTSQVPGVGASAYTNSYLGATTTTLYNVDETNNRLVTQTPVNSAELISSLVVALRVTSRDPYGA